MTPAERRAKEDAEEMANLKELLKFYVEEGEKVLSLTKQEVDRHIDDILDLIIELKNRQDDEH